MTTTTTDPSLSFITTTRSYLWPPYSEGCPRITWHGVEVYKEGMSKYKAEFYTAGLARAFMDGIRLACTLNEIEPPIIPEIVGEPEVRL